MKDKFYKDEDMALPIPLIDSKTTFRIRLTMVSDRNSETTMQKFSKCLATKKYNYMILFHRYLHIDL